MATIDLNNLIRPKQTNYITPDLKKQVQSQLPVYVDLHLDISFSNSVGNGLNVSISNDIMVDTDIKAINNSIKNIFNTKRGQKLLNPDFGSSLEQYLFEPVTSLGAKAIGDMIYNSISKYEPRITVSKVHVQTFPDNITSDFLNGFNSGVTTDNSIYGAGYGIGIAYQVNETKAQALINMAAMLGGRILF